MELIYCLQPFLPRVDSPLWVSYASFQQLSTRTPSPSKNSPTTSVYSPTTTFPQQHVPVPVASLGAWPYPHLQKKPASSTAIPYPFKLSSNVSKRQPSHTSVDGAVGSALHHQEVALPLTPVQLVPSPARKSPVQSLKIKIKVAKPVKTPSQTLQHRSISMPIIRPQSTPIFTGSQRLPRTAAAALPTAPAQSGMQKMRSD